MIRFDKTEHRYYDGEKELISVSALMRKHGLAPDYAGVPQDILRAKAERGSFIHEEIEKYIKDREIGFTKELSDFVELCGKNSLTPVKSEFIVHNDICAGTVDCFGFRTDGGDYFLADFKTTATLHYEAVRWQLSIYAALCGEQIEHLYVFHLRNDKDSKLQELVPIPREEVEKLFECERKGEKYTAPLATIENSLLDRTMAIQNALAELEQRKKELEEDEKSIKAALVAAMEKNGVKTFENDSLKITYVAPTVRKTLDSKKLKSERPDIFVYYAKKSEVKASVRITLKENENQ